MSTFDWSAALTAGHVFADRTSVPGADVVLRDLGAGNHDHAVLALGARAFLLDVGQPLSGADVLVGGGAGIVDDDDFVWRERLLKY